jgi:hypothetical protein
MKNSWKPRKAQMEIMGLTIIIILILIGVLFAVQFVIKKPAPELRESFLRTQQAANMLNAMLGTTTDCEGATVTELLQDCATTQSMYCATVDVNGNSCEYVELAMGKMFAETITKWNVDFNFSIAGPSGVSNIRFERGSCIGEKEVKIQPIPTMSGTVTLRLELCD